MILEIVKAAKLIRHKVKAENSVLELLIVIELLTLVATARQNRIEKEDGEASYDKNGVL